MVNYEPAFNDAVEFTLRKEGVLSNNPKDSGGLTKFGVTFELYSRINPEGTQQEFLAMPVEEAIDIYHAHFWIDNAIRNLPRELQLPAFDWAINSGSKLAIKKLQHLIGATEDGEIGPATIAKLASLQPPALRLLRNNYVTSRLIFLADLVQQQPKNVTFIEGWVRRVTSIYDFAY